MLTALAVSLAILVPSGSPAAPQVGEDAPFFRATDLAGTSYSRDTLRQAGETTILLFWAVRCAPCLREMAFMDAVHAKYKDRGVTVLGVESGKNDSLQIKEILEQLKNIRLAPQYPIVPDRDGALLGIFGVDEVPVTYILDKAGKVVLRLNEFSGEHKVQIEEVLNRLLNPGGAAPTAVPAAPASPPSVATTLPAGPRAAPPGEAPSILQQDTSRRLSGAVNLEDEVEKNRYFGDFHFHRGSLDKALSSYEKVLQIDPRNVYVLLKVGEVHAARKDYVKARERWEEVLLVEPGNQEAEDFLRRLLRGDF
jgi:peroxiredoxin